MRFTPWRYRCCNAMNAWKQTTPPRAKRNNRNSRSLRRYKAVATNITNPRTIFESSNKPKILGSDIPTQRAAYKKNKIMNPRLAGQNHRFSPRRGRMNELASRLNERTSTKDTSYPHVVPRYQSLLTKLTSMYSVTGDNVTIRKNTRSRMRYDKDVSRIPPIVAHTSNPSAIKSFCSIAK